MRHEVGSERLTRRGRVSSNRGEQADSGIEILGVEVGGRDLICALSLLEWRAAVQRLWNARVFLRPRAILKDQIVRVEPLLDRRTGSAKLRDHQSTRPDSRTEGIIGAVAEEAQSRPRG